MYVKEKPSCMPPAPLKQATSFKYISDGSGRDFYVTYNSGGLEAPYIPGTTMSDQRFITSLRSTAKNMGNKRLSTPAERQRMKKCRTAQKLLVRRLTATSKEWKEINREFKRQSLSRERELRSPQAAQQNRLSEYQLTRNNSIKGPLSIYNHIKEQETIPQQHPYPIYARSTRNLVNYHDLCFSYNQKCLVLRCSETHLQWKNFLQQRQQTRI
jgi:hypothetical protein